MTDIIERLNGDQYVDAIDDAIHEIDRLRRLEKEFERLKILVRQHSHNPELLCLVGPSEYEKGQTKSRKDDIAAAEAGRT
jgi:predicted HD phosphohydrolase